MANDSKPAGNSKAAGALTSPGYLVPFITVTALFFVFGFITTLNMALVPDLRNIFNLPYGWAMLAESAFFLAYFVFSGPSSKLIEWIGYKQTMVVSLFIQVVGCALFIPAAKLVNFPLFLTAVFIVGAGVTALQTSANPYAAILGPEATAPARLTLAQAFNSIGATIAPIVGGAFFLSLGDTTDKAAIANGVRAPYIAIAAGLLVLGLAVIFSHLPAITWRALREGCRPGPGCNAQHLELPAYGAGGAGHLLLRRRGGGAGVDCGELFQIAGHGLAQDGVIPGVALLGRRARRTFARVVDADQGEGGKAAHHLWLLCFGVARDQHDFLG